MEHLDQEIVETQQAAKQAHSRAAAGADAADAADAAHTDAAHTDAAAAHASARRLRARKAGTHCGAQNLCGGGLAQLEWRELRLAERRQWQPFLELEPADRVGGAVPDEGGDQTRSGAIRRDQRCTRTQSECARARDVPLESGQQCRLRAHRHRLLPQALAFVEHALRIGLPVEPPVRNRRDT